VAPSASDDAVGRVSGAGRIARRSVGTFTKPSSEFRRLPVVEQQIDAAAAMVANYAAADFHDEMTYRLSFGDEGHGLPELAFDSPLEAVFWVWWNAAMRVSVLFRSEAMLHRHVTVEAGGQRYNLDFVVASRKGRPGWPLIAIELDGHAFHEKTLEQVTYRNQRDRALQQAGWRVFHFSFSEFTTDPVRSIWEVVEFAQTRYRESRFGKASADAGGSVSTPAPGPLGESQPIDGSGIPSLDPVPTLGG
jgi:very-short-patch-repair endonuclease